MLWHWKIGLGVGLGFLSAMGLDALIDAGATHFAVVLGIVLGMFIGKPWSEMNGRQ